MAMFDFLKRKERELPLPPPPLPPAPQGRMQGDFEQIRAPPLQQMREWQQPMMQEEHHDEELHDSAPLPPLPPMPPLMEEHEDGNHDEQLLLPAPAEEEEVVFDRTVQAQRQELSRPAPVREPAERKIPAKTFVSVNDYKQILTETNMVRQRLMSADNFVKKLTDLKLEEEKSLERWRSQLEDVEKKLAYVDQLIEKAQR